MVITSNGEEVQAEEFFDTTAGVKGLVDLGVKKVPRIFHNNFKRLEDKPGMVKSQLSLPVIDIAGINQLDAAMHSDVVDKIRDASEKWGFFQVVNHGIPANVVDNMITAVRRFHEQDAEKKKPYITPDTRRLFKYNGLPFDRSRLRATAWGDCNSSSIDPLAPNFGQVPEEFRSPILDYTSHAKTLSMTLFELLSEALELKTSHLKDLGCGDGLFIVGHYYPPCPEPELTLAAVSHTDIAFLNILAQNQIGGLQVLHKNEWVDVTPVPGGLVINFGDMMQLITNGKFKSVNHRVLAKKVGPRISVANFLGPVQDEGFTSTMYGPMEELLSEENPPIYKKTTMKDYSVHHYSNLVSNDGVNPLLAYKI